MTLVPVDIGFRAFDAHELLVHATALRAGLYREAGIAPRLVDLTFVNNAEQDPALVTVACGAAAQAREAGAAISIVMAACTVPMFWLCALERSGPREIRPGARVAGYPPGSPPAMLMRRAVSALGLDQDVDLTTSALRDDGARIGVLRTGDADLALLSSASLPFPERGLRPVLDVGMALGEPFVSTGLAVADDLAARDPRRVGALAAIHRRSLDLLHHDATAAERALSDTLGLSVALLPLIRERFSRDGALPAPVTETGSPRERPSACAPSAAGGSAPAPVTMLTRPPARGR